LDSGQLWPSLWEPVKISVTAAARNRVRWSIKGVGLWTGSVWCKVMNLCWIMICNFNPKLCDPLWWEVRASLVTIRESLVDLGRVLWDCNRGHAIRSNTYKVLYCGNKRSVIGDDGARNKASSKERVSNLCIEHGGWMLRSSVCICCHVQHSAV